MKNTYGAPAAQGSFPLSLCSTSPVLIAKISTIITKKYLNFCGLSKNNGYMKTNYMGDMTNIYRCKDYVRFKVINNCYAFTTPDHG